MSQAAPHPARSERKPLRLLVVLPSWVGDAVMATPALRLLRRSLPGAFIGGLVRPGLDELLAGTDLLDEVHVERSRGVMGPKIVASRIRPRRYDAALLLANSFSSALVTRLAFIPRRIGYDRDGRGLLLTERLQPPREAAGVRGKLGVGAFTPVSAVEYYVRAAASVVGEPVDGAVAGRLELGVTPEQDAAGKAILSRAGVAPGERYAVLNPGANDAAKRWPAERFGAIASHLARERGLIVLVSGSPGEADLCHQVVAADERAVALPPLGVTIGSLKPIIRGAAIMLTNDTGPRHIASAFAVPLVVLYGPTDARWTTLPPSGAPSIDVVADPALPPDQAADDHPERCRIDRIEFERVRDAVDAALGAR